MRKDGSRFTGEYEIVKPKEPTEQKKEIPRKEKTGSG